ncbi:unnamed protein product [Amoebophrya sp. A120]|nr:unnamed protein product [Amoebophrya sp. A120]CAD7976200.1 unnamed protein product [Amoebophrya sp. A120]|eukprot:GSA120T00026328001.1
MLTLIMPRVIFRRDCEKMKDRTPPVIRVVHLQMGNFRALRSKILDATASGSSDDKEKNADASSYLTDSWLFRPESDVEDFQLLQDLRMRKELDFEPEQL